MDRELFDRAERIRKEIEHILYRQELYPLPTEIDCLGAVKETLDILFDYRKEEILEFTRNLVETFESDREERIKQLEEEFEKL